MDTVGLDIYLDVSLLSFDKSEVIQKSQIVLEQGKQLPTKSDSIFIERAHAPYGGHIRISLMAKRSAGATRKILDECKKIPLVRWFSHVGTFFNNGQKAIQHIPVVGRPLEQLVPDAYQNVKLSYEISVTEEKKLIYRMELIRTSDNSPLSVFGGEFLLT